MDFLSKNSFTLKSGQTVKKDVVRSDETTVIIKPNTSSGQKAAAKRGELMQSNGYKTQKIFYDPKDLKYQKSSPTYIGQKQRK